MDPELQPGGPHDEYLRDVFEGTGEGNGIDIEVEDTSEDQSVTPPPSPGSPRNFAPKGPVRVRKAFRDRIQTPLNIQNVYTKAVNSTVDNSSSQANKFLEVLKHVITSSRLLSPDASIVPNTGVPFTADLPGLEDEGSTHERPWTANGVIVAGALGFGLACLCRWFYIGGVFRITFRRVTVATILIFSAAFVTSVYMRRQWLKYISEQTLTQANALVKYSDDFDSAATAACTFIMEVELVARGYRISLPMPPVSRLENQSVANGQNLKSLKIRRAVLMAFQQIAEVFYNTAEAIRELSNKEQLRQLQTFMYQVQDDKAINLVYARLKHIDGKDAQKTYELKEFHLLIQELRKKFLLGLMTIDSKNADSDYSKFLAALESLRTCNAVTTKACYDIRKILLDDETFTEAKTPATPQTPGHKQWRMQVRKIGNMNMNIRGLQAKMALLAEESTTTIEESEDLTQLGPMFVAQYDAIGKDLETLMEEWKAGKINLTSSITKTERRLSSRSSLMSPIPPTSELASVSEEGGNPEDALKKLNGDSSPLTAPTTPESPQQMEIFEAVAAFDRPRSLLTRSQRIEKMQKEREARNAAYDRGKANGYVLDELKQVLDHKRDSLLLIPKTRRSMPANTRPNTGGI